MSNLAEVSTTTLMEDLRRYLRYRDRLIRIGGAEKYVVVLAETRAALIERGFDPDVMMAVDPTDG